MTENQGLQNIPHNQAEGGSAVIVKDFYDTLWRVSPIDSRTTNYHSSHILPSITPKKLLIKQKATTIF